MIKISPCLWLASLLVLACSASGQQYAAVPADSSQVRNDDQGYPLATSLSSESLSVMISVLDGEGQATASLHSTDVSPSTPSFAGPKPRPRLGQPPPGGSGAAPQQSYRQRIEEVTSFLSALSNEFGNRWNSPMKTSEVLDWVHEIDAECVFAIDKRSHEVSIESLRNAPATEELERLRKTLDRSFDAPAAAPSRPFTSDASEMDRLQNFVLTLRPKKIPSSLLALPGTGLRFRVSIKVVQVGKKEQPSTDGLRHAGPPPPKPINPPVPAGFLQRALGESHSWNLSEHQDPADPVFQYALGWCYLNGENLPRDLDLGYYWTQKSADQGYDRAQLLLGGIYHFARGVPPDVAKAMSWYRKAAANGNSVAMYRIGCMYQNGSGVEKDPIEGARWLQRSADLDYMLAQYTLGKCYAEGEGVEKNSSEALKWYRKAAEQGLANAQYAVGKSYELGLGVARDELEALAWYYLEPTDESDHTDRYDLLSRQLGPEATAKAGHHANEIRANFHMSSASSDD